MFRKVLVSSGSLIPVYQRSRPLGTAVVLSFCSVNATPKLKGQVAFLKRDGCVTVNLSGPLVLPRASGGRPVR